MAITHQVLSMQEDTRSSYGSQADDLMMTGVRLGMRGCQGISDENGGIVLLINEVGVEAVRSALYYYLDKSVWLNLPANGLSHPATLTKWVYREGNDI